jgi:hypothetical protein
MAYFKNNSIFIFFFFGGKFKILSFFSHTLTFSYLEGSAFRIYIKLF